MRELRACDFCGDDAVGVYEPLPPEVGSQRRVALCSGCRDTLEGLLAPLEANSGETPAVTIDDGTGEQTDATRESDIGADGPDVTDEDDASDPGGEESNAANEGETSARAEEPGGFRKVMRLLNNRSFPLERTVAVELASGAYELSDSEVEGVLDYAVERGVLEETGGELRRG